MRPKKRMTRVKIPRYQGVYFREHPSRKHNGKPDRVFDITFKNRGRLIWEKVGWTSEGYSAAMAAQVRAERIRTLRHGEELPQSKKRVQTFGQAFEKYLAWSEVSKQSSKTDKYRYAGVKRDLENKSLDEINPTMLEGMKIKMLKSGLSPQSVCHNFGLVRGVVNQAKLRGDYVGENPVSKMRLPSVKHTARVRFLTPAEAKRVLEGVGKHSQQLLEICLISLHAGLRAGEIFGIRWGDLNIENGLIHVQNSKTGVARFAFLTDDLKEIFSGKDAGDPKDLVYLSQWGKKIKNISGTYDKVISELGLNDGVDDRRQRVVFHTLRHTFASWLAIQGTPILTIRELLGHKRLDMTLRYAHLSPDVKRTAVEGLQKFFTENGNVAKEKIVE